MLVLASRKLKSLDEEPIQDPDKIIHLDLSHNLLVSGSKFIKFPNLQTLIIDNNLFFTIRDFPKIKSLRTFSANKNNFSLLIEFLECFKDKFPNALHLSIVKNPICPLFEGEEKYKKYKETVLDYLPNLKNLDGFDIILEKNKILKRNITALTGKSTTNSNEKQSEKVDIGLYTSKKTNIAYKLSDNQQIKEEEKDNDQDENVDVDDQGENDNATIMTVGPDGKKLLTVIEYSAKYKNGRKNNNLLLRSEGNRFIENDKLQQDSN